MTPKERAAMQQALEWIEDAVVVLSHASSAIQGGIGAEAEGVGGCSVRVVAALREALASRCQTTTTEQAEQEPIRLQCTTCGTVYANGVPPQVEQAEQEPVGYFAYDEEHDIWEELTGPNAPGATKLYAAPVRTKDPCNPLQDLTDDEIDTVEQRIYAKTIQKGNLQAVYLNEFARAVIAADRRKNNANNNT